MKLPVGLRTMSRTGMIFAGLVVLIALSGWGIYLLQKSRSAENAQQEALIAAAEKKMAQEAAQSKAAATAAADLKTRAKAIQSTETAASADPVVHKGEGVEHPLIRQLEANPSIADILPSRFTGNRSDMAAVKQWAEHEAAVLAIKAGLVGWRFGEEYRIKTPDTVAVTIAHDPNGGLIIVQYAASSTLLEKSAAMKTAETTATVAPPTPLAPQNVSVAGIAYQQVAAFIVASTVAKSHVPFVTQPSGDIVFQSSFAYIEDGVPPHNG